MATPYIPAKDADFALWLANFNALIAATPTAYGLVTGDATAITAVATPFATAYAAAINPTTRTSATIATKDAARANAEAVVRPYAIRIRNNAAISDALKVGLGLTIPSFPPVPIPAPTDAPQIDLQNAQSMQLNLTYKTVGSVGKGKPFGAVGVQIWASVGTVAATDPAQASFQKTVTKSPFRLTFAADQVGKIATIWARFNTRSGAGGEAQFGPWSTSLVTHVI